jgi:hypothetical protein
LLWQLQRQHRRIGAGTPRPASGLLALTALLPRLALTAALLAALTWLLIGAGPAFRRLAGHLGLDCLFGSLASRVTRNVRMYAVFRQF